MKIAWRPQGVGIRRNMRSSVIVHITNVTCNSFMTGRLLTSTLHWNVTVDQTSSNAMEGRFKMLNISINKTLYKCVRIVLIMQKNSDKFL